MPEYFGFDYLQEQFKKPIRGVVHIGAHYAEEAWEYAALGWPAIWIEAHPDYAVKMRENLEYYPEQKGFELCLSDQDGQEVTFWITRDEYASSMLKPKLHQDYNPHALVNGSINLTTTRFDTWIQQNNIDLSPYNLLVLDVQGAEDKVFRGIGEYINHFDGIISEYSTVEYYENVPKLEDLDRLYKDFERVYPDERLTQPHGDALYIRK
jgi:FkbM family methyltransferase